MAATIYFHFFEKNNQLIVDHVGSNGISNSYVTADRDRIDLSNLEPVRYIARANTDHDHVFHIDHDGKRYTLDGGAAPAVMIDRPIVNASLTIYDSAKDGDKMFSISFNALCFHPHTMIKTLNGAVMIKDLKRGDCVETLGGFKPVSQIIKTNVIGESHDFVKFPPHCFGANVPHKDVYCTRHHPVGVNFKNVPAEACIGKIPGVELVKMNVAAYYNIQFDTAEWLNVCGMFFTSHHPNHPVSPLPKELYHNVGNFREGNFYEDTTDLDAAFRAGL